MNVWGLVVVVVRAAVVVGEVVIGDVASNGRGESGR